MDFDCHEGQLHKLPSSGSRRGRKEGLSSSSSQSASQSSQHLIDNSSPRHHYNYSHNNHRHYTKKHYKQQQQQQKQQQQQQQQQQTNMNNLAPRFQQRALYSQTYQTNSDYPSSWRANLIAASHRHHHHGSPTAKVVVNLGVRPDPEGAPATVATKDDCPDKDDEAAKLVRAVTSCSRGAVTRSSRGPLKCCDYERVLSETGALFSDYGSDTDSELDQDQSDQWSSACLVSRGRVSTAAILTRALSVADGCSRRTALSFAVIGAEINSVGGAHHAGRVESELSSLQQRSTRLTDRIDRARTGLREAALGIRAVKQDAKQAATTTTAGSQKHSRKNSSQSDLSSISEQNTSSTKTSQHKSGVQTVRWPLEDMDVPDYCTIIRRHRPRRHRHSTDFGLSNGNPLCLESSQSLKR